jgi:glycosyltransferase involved in cell wall biosynthesis
MSAVSGAWARDRGECPQPRYRTRVLVSCDHYLPGSQGGGPIRSIAALRDALAEDVDFHVVTRDRDLGARRAYPDVVVGRWTEHAGTAVLYCPPGMPSLKRWEMTIRDVRPDVVYLNSMFSPRYSLAPLLARRLGYVGGPRFLLAPRGELHPGALAIRRAKKTAFLRLAMGTRLLRGVAWHATTSEEAEQIRRWFGARATIIVAPVLSTRAPVTTTRRPPKRSGHLEVVFLSRICPKKNLLGAIEMLRDVPGTVRFNLFGPKEDRDYWAKCSAAISRLPANVTVSDHGPVGADHVPDAFARNHVLLFPTHGENFGHVIAEALVAGVPVLVSDKTPWRDLAKHRAGWDIPLDRSDLFRERLAALIAMDGAEFDGWSEGARRCGLARANEVFSVQRNRELFTGLGSP